GNASSSPEGAEQTSSRGNAPGTETPRRNQPCKGVTGGDPRAVCVAPSGLGWNGRRDPGALPRADVFGPFGAGIRAIVPHYTFSFPLAGIHLESSPERRACLASPGRIRDGPLRIGASHELS